MSSASERGRGQEAEAEAEGRPVQRYCASEVGLAGLQSARVVAEELQVGTQEGMLRAAGEGRPRVVRAAGEARTASRRLKPNADERAEEAEPRLTCAPEVGEVPRGQELPGCFPFAARLWIQDEREEAEGVPCRDQRAVPGPRVQEEQTRGAAVEQGLLVHSWRGKRSVQGALEAQARSQDEAVGPSSVLGPSVRGELELHGQGAPREVSQRKTDWVAEEEPQTKKSRHVEVWMAVFLEQVVYLSITVSGLVNQGSNAHTQSTLACGFEFRHATREEPTELRRATRRG
ncbi:uncharacterized protein BXZ73DRAFT_74390 [Epithele typhae]|uniref:uncharacterized protein n=1 Tax=Epithele typhae TaxID=378194 RepID=UPI0020077F33|nr:uncharacterized protein BXZ73DRAFT_74390 [Epithele typhae]KAH9943442.1 hypothetical protein BXZ73DRAFT_74390 [Epithele typhae]